MKIQTNARGTARSTFLAENRGPTLVGFAAASIKNVHGIAIRGTRVFLAAVREFYAGDIAPDGTITNLQTLYSDLPDAGQHPNRTVKVAPDGRILLSVGSTNNAAPEPNPESATLLELAADGSGRTVYAKGLRNTIGFDWPPPQRANSGGWITVSIGWAIWSSAKLNLLVAGGDYGWPFIYDDRKFNMHQNPKETTGLTREEYAARTAPPVLGLEPHAAPMEMLFYSGAQFPGEYRNSDRLHQHVHLRYPKRSGLGAGVDRGRNRFFNSDGGQCSSADRCNSGAINLRAAGRARFGGLRCHQTDPTTRAHAPQQRFVCRMIGAFPCYLVAGGARNLSRPLLATASIAASIPY